MSDWARIPVRQIEDLRDAVVGAGLEAIQLSRAPLSASLLFGESDNMVVTSGHLGGQVMLSGPLSQQGVTFGYGLSVPAGTSHWMRAVHTGSIGVFLPGDESDALYMPGTFYATLTISQEHLEEQAARIGLVLDARTLGGTGFSQRLFSPATIEPLRRLFEQIHSNPVAARFGPEPIARSMLAIAIEHLAREPQCRPDRSLGDGQVKIVRRARDYIACNLDIPLTLDMIAAAAMTSHSSLFRAFRAILSETPQSYVLKLRLHRIRHDLASPKEAICTVTRVANMWGISELGRFSGTYRKHFGEFPSETLARQNVRERPFARLAGFA